MSDQSDSNTDFNRDEALALVALMPTALGADTAKVFGDYPAANVIELQRELSKQVNQVLNENDFSRCEAILAVQAQTLNVIFNQCMKRAMDQEQFKGLDIFMKQGLKAQAQCRQTIEALYALKNPAPSVVKQTNIANGPQQVNNGVNPNDQTNYQRTIREWEPWNNSTGPRSEEGKQRSAQNSRKHGLFTAAAKRERAAIEAIIADADDLAAAIVLSATRQSKGGLTATKPETNKDRVDPDNRFQRP